jgi:hypothetical protein
MANSGRHHADPDFIVAQIVQLELFNREWSAVLARYSGSYLHFDLLVVVTGMVSIPGLRNRYMRSARRCALVRVARPTCV